MIRLLDVVRAALGALDLSAMGPEIELGREPDAAERRVYRILGIRQLVQAAASALLPVRRIGVAVDLLHSASMAALAVAGPTGFRRAARAQAVLAAVLAGWGALESRRD